ncbi:MAG: D-alanine--D-alanine ligase A, partial [Clostridia bacterium]|nr:D-alanine--D-alanine ligase A [Clostridia bacterium]
MATTVCVIFGGKSSEHEVSCMSAYNIIKNLNREKYQLLTVGITKTGESFLYSGDIARIKDGSWMENPGKSCVISPNPMHGGWIVMNKNGDSFAQHVDVYFPVLHGKNGEDGTIQGVFELAQIPYVGNGVLGSSLCMDKILTKKVLMQAGVPVTDGFDVIHNAAECKDFVHNKICESFGYPVVVKPANAGSSVGISLVNEEAALDAALKTAAKEDR